MADNVHNVIKAHVAGPVVQVGSVNRLVVPRRRPPPIPRQLPVAIGGFVGRADQLTALDATAAGTGTRIAVVAGTAGTGKTALAVRWAHAVQHRFVDGTLFADLRGHGPDPPVEVDVVLGGFLQVLGVAPDRIPAERQAQVALYRSLLADRKVMVLLDNASSAAQVRSLLPGGDGCFVVVTSRSSLVGLAITDGAVRIPIGLFGPSEARTLLCELVGDRADADPAGLAELAAACARLPLALRIAGCWIAARPEISVADAVCEIRGANRLELLSRSGDARSALRDVFAWSYARLPTDLARMFRILGQHLGAEFSVHGAAAATGVDVATAARLLEALADVHLVEPMGLHRYRMHDLLLAYATELVKTEADLGSLLSWFAHAATVADGLIFPGPCPPDTGVRPHPVPVPLTTRTEALKWLATERASLVAAIKSAQVHEMHAVVIALACAMRFVTLGPRALWTLRLQAESAGLVAARACENQVVEAFLLMRRGDTAQLLGRWAESDADFLTEFALARELGDRSRTAEALCGLGRGRKLRQMYAEAWECYQQALPLVRVAHDELAEAVVECNLSQICARLGRFEDARSHAAQEWELRLRAEDWVGAAYALWDLAVAWQGLNDHDTTIEIGNRAVEMYRELGVSGEFLALALDTVAISYQAAGQVTEAVRCLREAESILDDLGDPRATVVRNRLSAHGSHAGQPGTTDSGPSG
jgi:tetratricopeptide (TPR) repeat protein